MKSIMFITKNKRIKVNFHRGPYSNHSHIFWHDKNGSMSRSYLPSYISTSGYKEWYWKGVFVLACACIEPICLHHSTVEEFYRKVDLL